MPFVDVDSYRMYYEIHGAGEPLVCASGMSTITGERLRLLPEQLREQFQIVVFDYPGLGRSPLAEVAEASTRQYAQDVLRLLDHLGLERAHCFGRGGLGACVMQEVALAGPDRVQTLVLSGGWAGPDPYHVSQQRVMMMLREHLGFEAYQLCSSVLTYTPEYFNEHHEALVGPHGPRSEMRDRTEAHLRLMRAGQEHDARARLPAISVPTLVIQGDETDILTGARLGREIASLIPGAKFVVLEGAPHVINSVPSAFQRLGEEIVAFLRRHPLSEPAPPATAAAPNR